MFQRWQGVDGLEEVPDEPLVKVPALSRVIVDVVGSRGVDGLEEVPDELPCKVPRGLNGLEEVPDPPRHKKDAH